MKRTYGNTLAILLGSLLLAGPAIGIESSSMPESKASDDSSVSSSAQELKHSRVASSSLNVDQIRELQRLLNDRGYSAGQVDGIIGPRTSGAIRQFQTASELTVNGTPDQATLRALAPDAKKQEFFGVAPAYGESERIRQQPLEKEPVKAIGPEPMNTEPMKTEPMKKGY